MSIIEYTAKRPQYPGHVENESYSVELLLQSATSQVVDVKETARSPGGAFEANLLRTDVIWTIQFAPVRGLDKVLLDELLESIETGESWKVWIGDAAAPLLLKCGDDVYAKTAFSRTGSEDGDYWTATVQAYQSSAYDPTGSQPPTADGGSGAGTGEETSDIYDPAIGGEDGGMDPARVSGTFTIEAEALPVLLGIHEAGYYNTTGSSYGLLISSDMAPNVPAFVDTVERDDHPGEVLLFFGIYIPDAAGVPTQSFFNQLVIPGIGTLLTSDCADNDFSPAFGQSTVGTGPYAGMRVAYWTWSNATQPITPMADATEYTATFN